MTDPTLDSFAAMMQLYKTAFQSHETKGKACSLDWDNDDKTWSFDGLKAPSLLDLFDHIDREIQSTKWEEETILVCNTCACYICNADMDHVGQACIDWEAATRAEGWFISLGEGTEHESGKLCEACDAVHDTLYEMTKLRRL